MLSRFRCQVGPAPGLSAVQSSLAVVTVQVEPSPPVIINGNTMEVMEGSEVEVTCKVLGGKPPATIKWLDAKNAEISKKGKDDKKIVSETTENIDNSKNKNIISTITLDVKKEMDQTNLTCHAEHPTFSKPKTTQILLQVQYKPELTIVQGIGADDNNMISITMLITMSMSMSRALQDQGWRHCKANLHS